jgi:hypothetical protein
VGDVEPRSGDVLLQPISLLHDALSDGDALLGILGKFPAGRRGFKDLLFAAWKRLGETGKNRLLERGT